MSCVIDLMGTVTDNLLYAYMLYEIGDENKGEKGKKIK